MSTRHPLTEYAARKGVALDVIAKKAGCSRMTLYRIMAGENTTIETLEKVSGATDGEVPVSSFLRGAAA